MTIKGGQLRIAAKNPCRVASTANIDLTTGGLISVDGITVAAGDRVLAKDQTVGGENGIYIAGSGSWTRAEDFDVAVQDYVEAGLNTYIQEGTANAKKTFYLTTTGTITIDTTPLTFEEGPTAGAGGGGLGGSTGATDGAVILADGTGGSLVKSSNLTIADIRDYNPVKRPCVAATVSNIANLATGAPSIVDGVSLAVNDRVLVLNQTVGSENGIYEVTTLGIGSNGTWTRASDFFGATSDYIEAGVETYVASGNTWGQTRFTLVTTGVITIGTTSLEFIPEGGLARTDASSTEVIALTAFTSGTFVTSSTVDMRDHSELAVFFDPTSLGSNTQVDIVIFWSDDGTTIPFATDDNIQQSDFLISGGSDGSFAPKPYTARLTTAGGELVANQKVHLVFPKGGGACRVGVKGNAANGTFSVRTQRLVG